MHATQEQIAALLKVQHIDLECARLQKQLDGLPQKAQIADVRKKLSALAEKQAAVAELRKQSQAQHACAMSEDADLARKQEDAQAAIEAAAGDYRTVSARTKEMEGYAARREVLGRELADLSEKLSQTDALTAEMQRMEQAFSAKEAALIESYKARGGELLAAQAARKPERARLEEVVGPQIMGTYDRLAKAKGGVALAYLDENRCNTCRSAFDQSRVLGLRQEAPLTTCPACGRLMVVDKRYNG